MNATQDRDPADRDPMDPWNVAEQGQPVASDDARDNAEEPGTLRPARAERLSRGVRAAAMVAGGLVAGGVLAGAVGASAATNATGSTPAANGYGTAGQPPAGSGGGGRSDETVVTGTKADTLRAAALKAVPGGTVDRIETDAGDAAYEVHMRKSDGTRVTVKFDDNLALVRVEDGMGLGDPAPPGAGSSGSGSGSGSSGSSTSPTPSA